LKCDGVVHVLDDDRMYLDESKLAALAL
jgi:hypothetical protein